MLHIGTLWFTSVSGFSRWPPYANPTPEDDEYLAYVRASGIPEHTVTTAIRMKALVPAFLESAANELLAGTPHVVGFSTVFQQTGESGQGSGSAPRA
jgi:hypothetical protein